MLSTVVVVGAGHSGFQCVASLRQEAFQGRILLVGDERTLPYQRPPLSKTYLQGVIDEASLAFRAESFYAEHAIERIEGNAVRIDRDRAVLVLDDGRELGWSQLVLATGSRHRRLDVPGAQLQGVHGLQNLADADALRARLDGSRHAVVIGAGFIGLEFAAFARAQGLSVHVLELGTRPMARVLGATSSEFFRRAHEATGVDFLWGQGVAALEGKDGHVRAVVTTGGVRLPADIVLVGIGATPNVRLAEDAGLAVENGIHVDATLRTSDERIFAIGDAAAFPHPRDGRRLRLESVQNAGDQARTVAARIAGKDARYSAVPWFWSDQGAFRLQIAGLRGPGYEEVAVDPQDGALTVLVFEGKRLCAVESVNRPGDHMLARRLLARGVGPTAQEARTPGFSLKAWAERT